MAQAQEQSQSGANKGQPSSQGSEAQTTSSASGSQSSEDKPGALGRLKRHVRDQISSGCVNAVGQHCWDKPAKDDDPKAEDQQGEKAGPPRSDENGGNANGESSSKSTKIDLSPPPGEAAAPGVGVDESDVHEMKPWDPHKADKDVEVGDFYFKRGNYNAAASRYAEALYWQDNHAVATFRLAQAEEKLGKFVEARKHYTAYLKILPQGEFAALATQGIERLKDKPDQPVRSSVEAPRMR